MMEQTNVEKTSNIITSIVFVAVFLVVMLLALVVTFSALNSRNPNIPSVNGVKTDTLNNAYNTTSYFSVINISNVQCTVNSVTDSTTGITISPSHYTINNCQITQIP